MISVLAEVNELMIFSRDSLFLVNIPVVGENYGGVLHLFHITWQSSFAHIYRSPTGTSNRDERS